ncbi:hypothetical protein V493_03462 [Pseudogymnoascus sp. VKM F-4281 (FW-2241)]|nr:hypothetical protein V493_03462 [Pseudogymnoascus sp. VKM F-4281 (FW-2241)]
MSDPDRSATEVHVAVVALIVSLVALLATTGQLLQQYFATADGYRRCQASVMGAWGNKTRLRWRWRQFRFETLYSTPEIFMTDLFYPICSAEHLLGLKDVNMHKLWNAPSPNNYGRVAGESRSNGELVSWLELLSQMHRSTRQSLSSFISQNDVNREIHLVDARQPFRPDYRRVPAIEVVERSWDFQPPDVSRPLAKTTLSTLAVMARRMGMRWRDFRPEDGIMHAEGNGHVLTSTVVRTLGLIVQYNYHGQTGSFFLRSSYPKKQRFATAFNNEEIYIPNPQADSLGGGVVRGDKRLGLSDFVLNTQDDIVNALDLLVPRHGMGDLLKEILRFDPAFTFPVGDLIALSMVSICLPNLGEHMSLVQIPAPSDNTGGVTTSRIGRLAFRSKLRDHLKDILSRNASAVNRLSRSASRNASAVDVPAVVSEIDLAADVSETESSAEPARFTTSWALAQIEQLIIEANDDDGLKEKPSKNEEDQGWIVRRKTSVVTLAVDIVAQCSGYLSKLSSEIPEFDYPAFLDSHIRCCVFGFQLQDNWDNGREPGSLERRMIQNFTRSEYEQVQQYFRRLPILIEHWKMLGWRNEKQVVDVWTVMMLRAFCWGICHFFVPGERVPIRYYGSQLPVWLS